ncbi:MAG: hypothetical protein AABX80_03075 [Nanoarchaeota archaeon]
MEIKNLIYQTGKILYKIVEIPFNVLVGNYSPQNQEIIKEKKQLKEKIKNLDSILKNLKIKRTEKFVKDLEKNLERKNPLAYQIYRNINLHRNMEKNYLIN